MGFLKAAAGAIGGTLADSWKDYFCCNSLDADVLVKKAEHKVNGRSSNTSGTENIITDGSKLIVADGQCALTVDQGKIFNIITEPGAYEFKSGTAPSLFSGGLGEGLKNTVKDMWERFTFGGEPAKDQRVYYMNLKEIIGNKYGTASPIPFRVVDTRARIDMDIAIKCFGEYSFKITNPVLFYTNVCANIVDEFTRDQIASQLKTELLTALQPTFALLSEKGIRYSALPGHTEEISQYLNQQLSAKWKDLRGIEVVSFGVSSVTADEEDAKKIKQMQEKGSKNHIILPEEFKEYIAVYTTEYDDSYLIETIASEDINVMRDAVQGKAERMVEAEINYENVDEGAGIQQNLHLVKIRKLNRKIGENLKLLYGYRCQLCGQLIGEKFGSHVAEAHHIDYFVTSLNNDASNQIIVCPNHHSIIHDRDPVYDRRRKLYRYDNGKE